MMRHGDMLSEQRHPECTVFVLIQIFNPVHGILLVSFPNLTRLLK